jgi:hypothetical protein
MLSLYQPHAMDFSQFKYIDVDEGQRRFEDLVDLLKSGKESGFVLCHNGSPAALLLPASDS